MVKPISLRLSNNATAQARALLIRAGRGAQLKQQDNDKILRQARENLGRGKEYTRLRRNAQHRARLALTAIARAYSAWDRINPTPSPAEYERRALIEVELKRIAGLP
jgi:hypothetical protein